MKQVVQQYASAADLQLPEQTILNLVAKSITNGKMLDIGVGGGRTTLHFAPLVNEYVGIDYSEKMIEACQQRFHPVPPNISFKVCEAKEMSAFSSRYFDFVLASYNCIDSAPHVERIKTLEEMGRVCKKGGFVCFSSHNLLCDGLFKIKLGRNPFRMVLELCLYLWLVGLNGGRKGFASRDYAMIRDGDQLFSMQYYYIKPIKQVDQLKELGFKNVRIFDLDGREIAAGSDLEALRDCWLYYLCEAA